jgi:DNA-binding NarL/FixJ family response regulator
MKILLAEKSKHLVSALMLVITQIKDTEVKEIGQILNVDKVDNLYKELRKEKPHVLIINGGFVNHKTRDMIPELEMLYPGMAIMILSTDPELEKKYAEVGMGNFILKGNSAEDFYNSMVIFLRNEQKRFLKGYSNN